MGRDPSALRESVAPWEDNSRRDSLPVGFGVDNRGRFSSDTEIGRELSPPEVRMLSGALRVPTSVKDCELAGFLLSGARSSVISDATQANAAVANVFSSAVLIPWSREADSEFVTSPATSACSTLLRNAVSVSFSAFKMVRSERADDLSLESVSVSLALEPRRVERRVGSPPPSVPPS